MLKTFALIALLHGNAYTLDTGMSGEDCITAIEAGVTAIEVNPGQFFDADGAVFACEVEQ